MLHNLETKRFMTENERYYIATILIIKTHLTNENKFTTLQSHGTLRIHHGISVPYRTGLSDIRKTTKRLQTLHLLELQNYLLFKASIRKKQQNTGSDLGNKRFPTYHKVLILRTDNTLTHSPAVQETGIRKFSPRRNKTWNRHMINKIHHTKTELQTRIKQQPSIRGYTSSKNRNFRKKRGNYEQPKKEPGAFDFS